jgi:hypothetical protein
MSRKIIRPKGSERYSSYSAERKPPGKPRDYARALQIQAQTVDASLLRLKAKDETVIVPQLDRVGGKYPPNCFYGVTIIIPRGLNPRLIRLTKPRTQEVHGEAVINWFGCDRWCDVLEEKTSRRLRR